MQNTTNMGPGGRVLHSKEAMGMKCSHRGQTWCLLSSPSLTPSSPLDQSAELTLQRRGGDWVDGVTVGCHALEGQRGGDVTAVGR